MDLKEQVHELALTMFIDNSELRWGQCLFNALYDLNPGVAEMIRGSSIDPFYVDARSPLFLNFIDSWK